MNYQTTSQLRLKPRGLGRHDFSAVGNIHDLLHGDGIEGQSHTHFARINPTTKFAQATQATHEVDTLVAPQIGYAQQLVDD